MAIIDYDIKIIEYMCIFESIIDYGSRLIDYMYDFWFFLLY